jgi:hypothetical protein
MARLTLTDQERADRTATIHGPTLVHLVRAVERGHTNFVFNHSELVHTFPDIRTSDVGRLAFVLGEGWGVHPSMRHVLTFKGEKRDGLRRLRGLLDGRD